MKLLFGKAYDSSNKMHLVYLSKFDQLVEWNGKKYSHISDDCLESFIKEFTETDNENLYKEMCCDEELYPISDTYRCLRMGNDMKSYIIGYGTSYETARAHCKANIHYLLTYNIY